MRLLAFEEYGLRCLLQMALRNLQGSVSVQEIARVEGLAPDCVAPILSRLHDGGLPQGARDPGTGDRLARAAGEISVWEAMTVPGGEIFPEGFCDCHPGQRRECVHTTDDAVVRPLWQRVEATLQEALDTISLEDLLQDGRGSVPDLMH